VNYYEKALKILFGLPILRPPLALRPGTTVLLPPLPTPLVMGFL